jgi:hypothetical protein
LPARTKLSDFIARFAKVKLTNPQECALLRLVENAVTDADTFVIEAIPLIFKANADEAVRCGALRIALKLPRNPDVIKLAAGAVQRALPWGPLPVAGLALLSVAPNASLAPPIAERFTADERNSIFHTQFVKFVATALPIPELRAKLLEILVPTIAKVTQLADWRKNAGKVAFWMQIGEMADGYVKKGSPSWESFRAGPLKKWAARLEDVAKEGVPLTGPPKINDDALTRGATPEAANLDVPKSATLDVPKSAALDAPKSATLDAPESATGAVEFGEFPAFDEPVDEPPKFGSGGFGAVDDGKKPAEEIGFGDFPAFDEPENEVPKFGSGGFAAVGDDKKRTEDAGFGDFPAFDEAEDGAPKFGSADEAKKPEEDAAFGEFPAFDEPDGAGFGTADDATKPAEAADRKRAADDVSYETFLGLLGHPCWEYTGPSPAELFGQKERFASSEEAFSFLINQP